MKIQENKIKLKAMRDTFLYSLYEHMLKDKKIIFVSADFGSPVLDKIREDCPDQFYNVGIAEQNLINVCAGLALEGYKIFAYAIAPFITMRCFEQIRVNLALLSKVREINVNLIGVGAGYSYVVSGPTHQCYEDISIMRSLPNVKIFSPSDQITAESLPNKCLLEEGPKYIRLDAQVLDILACKDKDFHHGFRRIFNGDDVLIISTGYLTHTAVKVAENLKKRGFSVGLIDLLDITGFDEKRLLKYINKASNLVSMEEGFIGRGGIDSIFYNLINRRGILREYRAFGVYPDYIFEIGDRDYIHEIVGIGKKVLTKKILSFLKGKK